ncbi:MAG: biotin--[acetyl-CoA-carboxylase] ligase [Sulfurospirillaceae bacterium]|nr:biotin--[acetyl-CoA-carboxylase] ligase [Sulfurospirillaceae bacterium]
MLEIYWYKHLPSTHLYAIDGIKNASLTPPFTIGVDVQSEGVGSRGNVWQGEEGNLFFSFCVEEKQLPEDLPLASISIYFSFIMKECLEALGSKVWLKWPNDFYLKEAKVGGVITTKVKQYIIGSIGINIGVGPDNFASLDICVEPKKIVALFLKSLEKKITWKKVFSKYEIEFAKSKDFSFHLNGKLVSLGHATLCEDGSVAIENKRVYSLR